MRREHWGAPIEAVHLKLPLRLYSAVLNFFTAPIVTQISNFGFSNHYFSDVSGSSDGSIRLWEWGVGQPFFTPRIAGQYAKVCFLLIPKVCLGWGYKLLTIFSLCQVTKVLFSCNGSKFASVDNDGILCLWQTTQGLPIKKPFFVSSLIANNMLIHQI